MFIRHVTLLTATTLMANTLPHCHDKNPYAWDPIGLTRGYTPPKNTRVGSHRISTCVSPP
jgi:hypothetical protein